MVKIFIKTWGCQSNIADSEQLAGLLKQRGYNLVNSEKEADFIIANTCTVKSRTQSKELHYIRENSKDKKILVGGCLTKTLDLRKYIPGVTAIFDTNSITKVPNIIEKPKDILSDKKESRISLPYIRKDKDTAIINIGQGCNSFCDFCATKLARGNLKSYRVGDIKRTLEKAVKEGCNRINISSQDNSCYGFDIKTSLPELLKELITIKGNYQIRIGMMNPGDTLKIMKDLIKIYKNNKVMKFLHIPIQSGSNYLLKKMRRKHTVEDFIRIVKAFRKGIPNVTIASDVIIGHPLEKNIDFQKTYDLIAETKPEVLNISKFSSRPGTEASKLPQLSSEIMNERSKKISNLYQKIRTQF